MHYLVMELEVCLNFKSRSVKQDRTLSPQSTTQTVTSVSVNSQLLISWRSEVLYLIINFYDHYLATSFLNTTHFLIWQGLNKNSEFL